MIFDPALLLPILQPVALAVVAIALPACSVLLLRAVGLQATDTRISLVENALLDAAHGMYLYFVMHKKPVTDRAAFSEAVAQAVEHVTTTLPPGTLAKHGIDAGSIEALVTRKFGTVLAADPTITVAPSAAVVSIESIPRSVPRAQ